MRSWKYAFKYSKETTALGRIYEGSKMKPLKVYRDTDFGSDETIEEIYNWICMYDFMRVSQLDI